MRLAEFLDRGLGGNPAQRNRHRRLARRRGARIVVAALLGQHAQRVRQRHVVEFHVPQGAAHRRGGRRARAQQRGQMHGLAQAGRLDFNPARRDVLHHHLQGQAGDRHDELAVGPHQDGGAFRHGQQRHAAAIPGDHGALQFHRAHGVELGLQRILHPHVGMGGIGRDGRRHRHRRFLRADRAAQPTGREHRPYRRVPRCSRCSHEVLPFSIACRWPTKTRPRKMPRTRNPRCRPRPRSGPVR